jgi:hypothetical protein
VGGLHLSLSSCGIHSLTRRTAPGGMWPQEWPQAKGAMCVDDMDLSGGPPRRRAGVTSRVSHPVERFPPPWQTRSRTALARHGGCQIASDRVGGPAFVGRGLVCVWRRPVQGFPGWALGSCRQRRVSRRQDEAGRLRNAGFRMRLANRRTNAWRAAPHAGTRQRARKVAEKRKRQMRWSSRSGSWLCIIQREAGNQAHRDLDPGGRDRSRIVVTGPEERESRMVPVGSRPRGARNGLGNYCRLSDDGNEIPKRPPAWPGTGRLFVAHAPQPGCLAVIGSWRAQLASLQVHPPPRGSRLGLS